MTLRFTDYRVCKRMSPNFGIGRTAIIVCIIYDDCI